MVVLQIKLTEMLMYSFVIGMVFGGIYDIFRIRRLCFKMGKGTAFSGKAVKAMEWTLIFFEDLLFAFICALISCVFIFYMNSGRMRGVVLAGEAAGFLVYYHTLGRLVLHVSVYVIGFAGRLLRWVGKTLFLPVIRVVKRLFGQTFGRWAMAVYTFIVKKMMLRDAEAGFGIKRIRGKKKDEETFKYIREGGRRGVHTVLRGDHNSDAV